MPLQTAIAVENNFRDGLKTEFSGLNFPEKACTETYDCRFSFNGSVSRRLGFDFESNHSTKTINRANSAVVSYLWKNVAGDGNVTLSVLQVGATVYFYNVSGGIVSNGALTDTVTLTPVSTAPAVEPVEAQFSDGGGYLFITHPYVETIRVSYSSGSISATNIAVSIRDFEGATADPNAVDTRPTSTLAGLNVSHAYNLYNQGWNTTNLTAWDTAQTTMPSNADVMWAFKDTSDNFDASTAAIARVIAGNTPAPKGHFILSLFNQNRNTASGLSGVAATTTGYQRLSTSVFYAGRLFYAGLNYTNFNSNIYFSQIVERPEQYGYCYQANDPSAETLFDLLPSDGGVISIKEAGTIFKMVVIPGGLLVFAANGVWFITGSTGLGFAANDYTVQKISSVSTISSSSFVDVEGFPIWWNTEGIYTVSGGNGLPEVKCLTDESIKSFYEDIPFHSKIHAKGYFNKITKKIQWLYKSVSTVQVTNIYEYDKILNLDTRTGAFYPWTVSDSDVKINGIIVTDSITGTTILDTVIDASSNNVIDALGNTVISFSVSSATSSSPSFKYITSYPSGSSYAFTFADESNTDYLDWFKYDIEGVNYTSYFITGFKIRGQGIKKFQSNWLKVFSELSASDISYYFQGLWDYATSGNTGRWSAKQYVNHPDADYSVLEKRLKVRGHGIALQFKVTSVPSKPFHIIGWAEFDTGNSTP